MVKTRQVMSNEKLNVDIYSYEQKREILKAIPLENLYKFHPKLICIIEKYFDKSTAYSLRPTIYETAYTSFQYLNRVVAISGGSLLLIGKGDVNSEYTKWGGMITLVSVYTEFFLSISKDKIFKIEEKKRKITKLIEEIESTYDGLLELREILKPLSISSLGKPLEEVCERLKKVIERSLEHSFRTMVLETLNLQKGDNLFLIKWVLERNGENFWNSYNSLARGARNLAEIKFLLEVLQESVSKYRQRISEEEIEKRIEKDMLKLEARIALGEFSYSLIPKSSVTEVINVLRKNQEGKFKNFFHKLRLEAENLELSIPNEKEFLKLMLLSSEGADRAIVFWKEETIDWKGEKVKKLLETLNEVNKILEEENTVLENINDQDITVIISGEPTKGKEKQENWELQKRRSNQIVPVERENESSKFYNEYQTYIEVPSKK